MGCEIFAVNPNGWAGGMTYWTHLLPICLTDVASLVSMVLIRSGGYPIDRLTIADHGTAGHVNFGTDTVNVISFSRFEPEFIKLRGHFSFGGFVQLYHCHAGENKRLLGMFAEAFGVPVVAGTGYQNGVFRFNLGLYTVCSPGGGSTTTCNSPDWDPIRLMTGAWVPTVYSAIAGLFK
jgi:hypothetical protein